MHLSHSHCHKPATIAGHWFQSARGIHGAVYAMDKPTCAGSPSNGTETSRDNTMLLRFSFVIHPAEASEEPTHDVYCLLAELSCVHLLAGKPLPEGRFNFALPCGEFEDRLATTLRIHCTARAKAPDTRHTWKATRVINLQFITCDADGSP